MIEEPSKRWEALKGGWAVEEILVTVYHSNPTKYRKELKNNGKLIFQQNYNSWTLGIHYFLCPRVNCPCCLLLASLLLFFLFILFSCASVWDNTRA